MAKLERIEDVVQNFLCQMDCLQNATLIGTRYGIKFFVAIHSIFMHFSANPCCSKWGYCGPGADHCSCPECKDFRTPSQQLSKDFLLEIAIKVVL